MLYLKRLEGILFYLVIFSISIQLGKHFWPEFSFINGIRLDYLSPTLYLSDIFIFIFIILRILISPRSLIVFFSKSFVLPLFLILILVSSFLAQSFEGSIYWSLKVVEMILFGWGIFSYEFKHDKFYKILDVLIVAAIIQSAIATFQFILQKSIGGPVYFLGERSFDVSTIGISTFFSSGQELLRPYGTFPHPNVLAMFLSIALLFSVYFIFSTKSSIRSYVYSFASVIIFLGLLSTVSRVIIFLTVLLSLFAFIRTRKHLIYAISLLAVLLPAYLLFFSGRFLTLGPVIDAFVIRMKMVEVALLLFKENILFGVGLNNTFYSLSADNLPIYARFQPVHNIYLQMLLQVGIFGAVAIAVFLSKVLYRVNHNIQKAGFPLVIVALLSLEIAVVGLFDHFSVTLQQGMMMTAFVLGLLFNESMESA